jgi:O-antigen/teichoic acid export membrane protein
LTSVSPELEAGHGAGRNTAFSMGAQMAGAVFSLVLTLFLVRKLGPADYGVLALAVSIGTVVLLASDLGISISASRFVAERPRDRLHAAAVLRTAFGLKLVASTVATIALVLLAPLLAEGFGTSSLTLPLRLVAIAVFAQNMGVLFLEWFAGLGRISLNLRYALAESSVEAAASISLVLLGGGAAGAVGGRAIGYVVAGILAAAFAVRVVGWPALRDSKDKGVSARAILRYGSALLLIDGAFVLFDRADVIIIGAVLNASSAGIYEAAARVITMLQYAGIAVGSGFGPRLAEGQRTEADVAYFMRALRYTVLLYLLLVAPTVVWAGPIVSLLLGPDYAESADVLRALAPTVLLSGIGPVLAGAANFLGQARRRVPIAAAALIVNVVIDLVLVPEIGIVAGAIGTGVAFTLYTGGHIAICQRALKTPFAPLLPTLVRGAVAATAAGLVLFAVGTADLSVLAWVLGTVAATVAYIGTLLLLRELKPAELKALIQRLIPARVKRPNGA